MLATLVERAKVAGQVSGVIPHLVEEGLSILQYADDTILFLDHDLDRAINLKLLLCSFEELSGLKINFHNSKLFCFGDAAEYAPEYADIFGCQLGQFLIRYLDIPIHYLRLTIAKWKHVEERLEKRLASWKAKLLSYGG